MLKNILLTLLVCSSLAFSPPDDTIFSAKNGVVKFASNAPLEAIKAESNKLSGAMNLAKRTFAFKIPNTTFDGFNSSLQKEHFNENYMESNKYPVSEFKGKIIEETDLNVPGTYNVRVKGMLNVHGVEKERILKAKVTVKEGQINIESVFPVLLVDHQIKIPKIVTQKIAESIDVDIKITLVPKV
jgi:hypothetical protein